MRITPRLDKKIAQAVQTSMRIEGYKKKPSAEIKKQAKALMERHHIRVSAGKK